jgi:methyl-accepting chemotaxis protein
VSLKAWIFALGGWRRGKRLEELREQVAAHLPLLPVVSAQLRDANRQVEQAVAKVGANFGRMAERAREGANEASRILGGVPESSGGSPVMGIDGLLSSSRATLEDLLSRIVRDGEVCHKLAGRMDSLERHMGHIVKALADVDRISFGNTILALNAKIEAAHMGERGQGFELVAQELWIQSQRSNQITEGIRATIAGLAGDAKSAMAEVGDMACADRDRIRTLERQVQDALGRLERAHQDMQESVAEGSERNEALAGEIAGAVETMQFQDRVSQQIGHIVEALESMRAAVAVPLGGLGGDPRDPHARGSEAARLLAGSYTMEAEREVHATALGEQAAGEMALSDVEIF